ncbi:peptide-methionine (S)-S-oxide reductase MsrA [uncultured Enterococcus sp.]|uniref:peptide-methionine (S)-S-oxide reductase MsrA n=1 Tax=uncultured Enterococcus sp. TaxID=167972 RepID=UPI0025DBDEE8|nr:peptide-methionine (S)-S-oxide reductase MsrA [uncultured Enterococcus sp.]
MTDDFILAHLYNLILNPGTREFEREQLIQAKNQLENGEETKRVLATLETQLRPLALRDNLTPDVMETYQEWFTSKKIVHSFTKEHTMIGEIAIFAGGCFWCMVEPFDTYPGVLSVESGYTGGHVINPTYDQILTGATGHTEAVRIIFDPMILNYQKLLEIYWQVTDPTDAFGQFQDRGSQYRPVIFYCNDIQKKLAEQSKASLTKLYLDPIVTQIVPSMPFYLAEHYHQDFYRKEPKRYRKMKQTRKQLQQFKNIMNWLKRYIL